MKLSSIHSIVQALHEADVKYLVAGGLAVNAHGFLRYTKDIDLVIDFEPGNLKRALTAFKKIGYRPTIPVSMDEFADQRQRKIWVEEKGMQVFQLWSDDHPETPIDIFSTAPFPFDQEYDKALVKSLYGVEEVRFVRVKTLIAMKAKAGRTQDKIDIEHLQATLDNNERS